MLNFAFIFPNSHWCNRFTLYANLFTLLKKGKIWGKNSYANRLLSYANRFALMEEANMVQNQLCKSIYTLCKSICTVKMLKNAPFDGCFYLVPTKHKHTKAQGNIFDILVSKTIYTRLRHGCSVIPLQMN